MKLFLRDGSISVGGANVGRKAEERGKEGYTETWPGESMDWSHILVKDLVKDIVLQLVDNGATGFLFAF